MAALTARARRFRKAVLAEFEPDPGELVLLDAAVAMVAEIDCMEAELAGAEVVVKGSRGQDRAHPLVGQLRQHRLALGQLLKQLQLPESLPVEAEKARGRSTKARRAALARWHGAPPG